MYASNPNPDFSQQPMRPGTRKPRVLVLASSYPTEAHPWRGVPIEERVRKLVASGKVGISVVNPVPWFSFHRDRIGGGRSRARIALRERRFGIPIEHPSYLLSPGFGHATGAASMARGVLPLLRQRLARGADFDLIEAHNLYPDGVAAVTLGGKVNKPVVLIARGPDASLLERQQSLRRRVLEATSTTAAVSAVSRALREKLLSLGLGGPRLSVLRDGVDLGRFRMSGHNTTKTKLRLSGSIWLTVGALTRRRRVELAIAALAKVTDATLLILGEGPEEARLRQRAGKLGVDARVHFLGGVAHNQLPRYYNAADALLHTPNSQDIPNSVLECLACGTRVIATPSAGAHEILGSPDAGEIAAAPDARDLEAAWRQLQSRQPQRADTRALAEAFGWHDVIPELVDLYAGVLASPAGVPAPRRASAAP